MGWVTARIQPACNSYFTSFKLYMYLFILHVCLGVHMPHATARVCPSEDNLRKCVLFLCVLGSAWLSDKWP